MAQITTSDVLKSTEYVDLEDIPTAPSAPASGVRLYSRSGTLYQKTSADANEIEAGGSTFAGDNLLIRTNTDNEPASSGITIDDSDNITGIASMGFSAGGATITAILDEDDFASDSATAVVTQQSAKAYIDANAGSSTNGTTMLREQRLTYSSGVAGDELGASIAVSGDGNTLAVGATLDDDTASNAGAVYIYTRTSATTDWSEAQKIVHSLADGVSPAADDEFGVDVAINTDGTVILVGCRENGTGGAVYVFTKSGGTWSQTQRLEPSDVQSGDDFGFSVDINGDGDIMVGGALLGDAPSASNSGAVYVFTESGGTWSQVAKLTASDAAASDNFGNTVRISRDGTTVAIGAPFDADEGAFTGAVYVFRGSGSSWSQLDKLLGSDAAAVDNTGFLRSIGISSDGSIIAFGSIGDDTNGSVSGAVYVFTESSGSWSQTQKLSASDASSGDALGRAIDITDDGNTIVAGAIDWDQDTLSLTEVGAIYIYYRTTTTWEELQRIEVFNRTQASSSRYGQAIGMDATGSVIVVGSESAGNLDNVYSYTRDGTALTFTNLSTYQAQPLGVINDNEFHFGLNAPRLLYGIAVPSVSAPKGSLYFRTQLGNTQSRFYINTDGSTTWKLVS